MSIFTDMFTAVKTAATNTAGVFVNNNVAALQDRANNLFTTQIPAKAAEINNTIQAVPAISLAPSGVSASPLPPVEASGAANQPSYAVPLALVGVLILFVIFRGK